MASTKIDRNAGLKATTTTKILDVIGKGCLLNISIIDPDALAQNEFVKITIDDTVVLADTNGVDVPSTQTYMAIHDSILLDKPIVSTTELLRTNQKVPFHRHLQVAYKRAAAGTAGLTINIEYELKG